MRIVIVASTAGSVMSEALRNPFFKNVVHSVVTDRRCAALERARGHGVRASMIRTKRRADFCRRLRAYLDEHRIDYVFSFSTGFYAPSLRTAYRDRIVNFHPSLLPAFKGLDAFIDAYNRGARFLGCTVELVDERMDEGKIILQAARPLDPTADIRVLRHAVFVLTCKATLQTARWLSDRRVHVVGRTVRIDGARFTGHDFSPALDFEDALSLNIPFPGTSAFPARLVRRTQQSRS